MIYFIFNRNNSFTLKRYLEGRGKSLADRIGIIYHDQLQDLEQIQCSTLIFSDLDFLDQQELTIMSGIYKELATNYPQIKLLNDPAKLKLRYDLLRSLFDQGMNPFNVYRFGEPLDNIRFPVFIRQENGHLGALTGLIYSHNDLRKNQLFVNLKGYTTRELLIVEYIHVAESNGLFKKYSALKVHDKIYPRHLDYSYHWVVKFSDSLDERFEEEYFAELQEFRQNIPHRAWVEKVFEMAGVDYGRIDYSIYRSKPVLWEINQNPTFGRSSEESSIPLINEFRTVFNNQLRQDLINLDTKNTTITLTIPHTKGTFAPTGMSLAIRTFYIKVVRREPFSTILWRLAAIIHRLFAGRKMVQGKGV